jgi:hypothetical protein
MPPSGPWLRQFAVICLILLMQGPAMLVQEVAWAKMLVTYTQERGWKRGLIETFDGKHPCKLCAKAAQIRKSPEKQDPAERLPGTAPIRLSWTEMVPAALISLPRAKVREISIPVDRYVAGPPGRGADSPESPPPEVG